MSAPRGTEYLAVVSYTASGIRSGIAYGYGGSPEQAVSALQDRCERRGYELVGEISVRPVGELPA